MRGSAVTPVGAMVGMLLLLGTCAPPAADTNVAHHRLAAPISVGPQEPAAPAAPAPNEAAESPPADDAPAEPAVVPAPPPPAPAPPPPPPPPPPPERPRAVVQTGWAPFATVHGVVLRHPSSRVERVGFHESNHDGARQLDILASAANPVVLETRDRGTGSQTAADVVSDPHGKIRAPVTGTVLRAGTYVLYCDYRDSYVVIEPDAHPGWEVKVLHITGVQVHPGNRVEAGATVLAAHPTSLPFSSQVDDHTGEPSWPHVHIEVVDPSIPNRPKPGGGC